MRYDRPGVRKPVVESYSASVSTTSTVIIRVKAAYIALVIVLNGQLSGGVTVVFINQSLDYLPGSKPGMSDVVGSITEEGGDTMEDAACVSEPDWKVAVKYECPREDVDCIRVLHDKD